ncbi:hypothetical protein [Streptomyces shenzhenensis]|uniref:hypothetical protein n=1 Tax=Streptomyces shenzhenensis TaxID=943815 RepID=UPI00215DC5D2|nr:hypothetical protein [Streptomyces shenzhenensis]
MFHYDWTHNGDTGAEAVRYHLVPESDPAEVLSLRRDARLLLEHLDSDMIETLWQAGTYPAGGFSDPRRGFTTGAEWMETITGLCDVWLAGKQNVSPLTGADAEDGAQLVDAVLAEIDQARFLPDRVRQALAECARRCTPDLAFRLLLRAIPQSVRGFDLPLTPEQYARLEELGSALYYGEFVVNDVKFAVEQD